MYAAERVETTVHFQGISVCISHMLCLVVIASIDIGELVLSYVYSMLWARLSNKSTAETCVVCSKNT